MSWGCTRTCDSDITGPSLPIRFKGHCMLLVDWTHMARRASGIERITKELFSAEALAPLAVTAVSGNGTRAAMLAQQQFVLPARALADRRAVALFPGYPPSVLFSRMRDRTVLYVHDLFLITRPHDLNGAGKYYLAPQFKQAIRRLKYFLTNSETTANELAGFVAPDAKIQTYRPAVRNVFGLTANAVSRRSDVPLVIGTVATIEPRKNLIAAARICDAASVVLKRNVEFHIIGRQGWGDDAAVLGRMPHVRLLGYLDDDAARQAIGRFDMFLTASHDEGLGLPLLEAQYAGLAVAAPDKPVFREVLGASGTYLDTSDAEASAGTLAALVAMPGWQEQSAASAASNIARWNALAARDRDAVIDFLQSRIAAVAPR